MFQPSTGMEEVVAVQRVLQSNWLAEGKQVEQFSVLFSRMIGGGGMYQAVATCTDGLFLTLAALGITCGDDVVMPTISFVGAANAVCATGARAVFCDVDARTLNPSVDDIMRAITTHTKAVIVLHYGGVPCDIEAIADFCLARRVKLIEDSACSVASKVGEKSCGTFGDVGLWSFDPMKIITTIEGGMVRTKSDTLGKKIRQLALLGMTSTSGLSSQKTTRWWEFDVTCFGRKAIMSDVSAAIGIEQLKKLPRFVARRKQIYERYVQQLSDVSWLHLPPQLSDNITSSYYFFWIQTSSALRDRLAAYLKEHDVYTTFRYHPLHTIRIYDHIGGLPGAETAARSTLLLPLHQMLIDYEVDMICDLIKRFSK